MANISNDLKWTNFVIVRGQLEIMIEPHRFLWCFYSASRTFDVNLCHFLSFKGAALYARKEDCLTLYTRTRQHVGHRHRAESRRRAVRPRSARRCSTAARKSARSTVASSADFIIHKCETNNSRRQPCSTWVKLVWSVAVMKFIK